MTPKITSADKGAKAREKLIELHGRGKELLLWNADRYTDDQIIIALEQAGFRWSERVGSWAWRQESFV